MTSADVRSEGRKNFHKAKQLHFKFLIAHRQRHNPLMKTSLAERRVRMLLYELENAHAALLNLVLERSHFSRLIRRYPIGKDSIPRLHDGEQAQVAPSKNN